MPRSSPFRAALALAALLAAVSCDRNPAVPIQAPGEAEFGLDPSIPAVPGFVAQTNIQSSIAPKALLSWQDVAGEDVFLIQWRVGDAGSWRTLVTTGRDRTSFGTDSARAGEINYYRIAAMTSDYRRGPFTTVVLAPYVRAYRSTVQPDSMSRIGLSFRNLGAPLTYLVEYGTDPGLADAVQTAGITSPDPQGDLSFDIPIAPGTTFYYRGRGTGDAVTANDSIRTFAAAPVLQATFHQLPVGTSLPGYRVELVWTQAPPVPVSYRVFRRIVGEPGWQPLGGRLGSNARSHTDLRIEPAPAHTYEYRIEVCSALSTAQLRPASHISGPCFFSGVVQVTTVAMPGPPDFSVTPLGGSWVRLQWGYLPGAEGYGIERRLGTGPWGPSSDFGASKRFLITTVGVGATYYFRVAGKVFQRRTGGYSTSDALTWAALTARTDGATVLPPASATVNGAVLSTGGLPATAWFEWSIDPTLYGSSSTSPQPADSGAAVSATINFPTPRTYYYRIAVSNGLAIAHGSIKMLYVGVPGPPDLTTASFSLPEHAVHLAWTHPDTGNLAHFRIFRGGVIAATVAADVRSFDDIVNGVSLTERRIHYWVQACNADDQCNSSPSRVVVVPPMSAPSGVAATLQPDGTVRVQWQDLPGNQLYKVQWRTSGMPSWVTVRVTGTNNTSYITSRVTAGTTNFYRVAGSLSIDLVGPYTETSLVVP